MTHNSIEVRLWGNRVGVVSAMPNSRAYVFQYYPSWLRENIDIAPFTMPVRAGTQLWTFPDLPDSFKRLPGLLADALPDKFGNDVTNAWMMSRNVAADSLTSLDRLAYMGKRAMGAMEFVPADGPQDESSAPIQMGQLVEEARVLINGSFKNEKAIASALSHIIEVGISAGGARAKAVIAWNPLTNEIRSGQFNTSGDFEHWLLKFDGLGEDRELGGSADYGRIEYAYHLMAHKGVGIDMSPCHLLQENGRAHFITKRFDRDANKKHHVQTLCALAHLDFNKAGTHSYEQFFAAIKQLNIGDAALSEGFRRMAFNIAAMNRDDHTKNFAFRMVKGGRWELSPAYDVTHAYNPAGVWTQRHQMSVNQKFVDISGEDMLTLASRFSIPNAKETLSGVNAALDSWPEFAAKAGLDQAAVDRIGDRFLRIAIPKETRGGRGRKI